ncbi:MAG: DegV family protein [Anaerolineae bacterium]
MSRVQVVTDSTADIPADMATELGISIVPCYVMFGAETYRDGLELTRDQFYEKLITSRELPTTAAPPPAAYEKVYRQLAAESKGIISIHLAANLSNLHRAASLGAQSVQEVPIHIIDSEQVTMGYGWMAVAAAEASRRGEKLERIVALVENMKARARVLAILNTLEFVHRGGRVSWAKAMIGTLMKIKPIVEVRQGKVRLLERTRSWARALDRLIELVHALGPLERAIVLHANAPAEAETLADRLQDMAPYWRRLVSQAGITIATHAGPGAVGIACVTAQ